MATWWCEHYLACWRHRGCRCEVCGGQLLYVKYDLAPDAPRCHGGGVDTTPKRKGRKSPAQRLTASALPDVADQAHRKESTATCEKQQEER